MNDLLNPLEPDEPWLIVVAGVLVLALGAVTIGIILML